MRRPPIVYIYPEAVYGADASRQTGLTRALAKFTHVVFVECAPPTRRIGRLPLPGVRFHEPHLTVVGNALGLTANRYARRMGRAARALDGYSLRRVLRRSGVTEYILWLSIARPELMEMLPTSNVVYDCIDPCFLPDQQEAYDRAEAQILARATTVFATSQTLLEHVRASYPQAQLLNNAADRELYIPGARADLPVPQPLRGRPHPVVGYLGTTDWRVDVHSLTAAAKALADYTFCIAGRVNQDQLPKTRELAALPNVVMPGSVPVDQGPAYNAAFDVGLIPYLPGYVGDAINPVKMYMYISMGKPVVSTWIRECRDAAPFVTATRDVPGLVAAIRSAAERDDPALAKARVAFAQRNSWDDRARTALALLDEGPSSNPRAGSAGL